jgi:uncharacterized cupin superfamily protein
MAGYSVAHLDEIDELTDGREPYRPVRHHLGISSFGATAWTGRSVGDRIINEHDEADDANEELYVVTQGHAVFELDGERVDAPSGTFVSAAPGIKRAAFAEKPGTTILAVGSALGKPYEATGWELWAPLRARYDAGKYREVAERLRSILAEHPRYALLFYNLACCESLTGHKDEAIGHLRQAIELSEKFRTYARHDSDLDAVRNEAAFEGLVGAGEADLAARVPEARLEQTESGLTPASEGWFVVNVRDTRWLNSKTFGSGCVFESHAHPFPEFGINIAVLQPGEPNCLYHSESQQEAFLVLSGECRLLVNGEERLLRAWDFVHCPAGTEHVFVGAGDGPSTILMAGARSENEQLRYPVSALAGRYGASSQTDTPDPRQAYAPFERPEATRPPYWQELAWA